MKKINKKSKNNKHKKNTKKYSKPINKVKSRRKENVNTIIEKRYKILILVVILLMLVILARLYILQVKRQDKYEVKLKELTEKIVKGDSTPRGRMYDRNGKIIVDNEAVKTIYYKKTGLSTDEEIALAYKMGDFIDVDFAKLTDDDIRIFWVESNPKKAKKKIKDKEWQKVKERKLTTDDIYELKKQRVTDEELNELTDKDKEAAYIYYLMNKGYSYAEKTIKNIDVTDEEYAKVAENIDKLKGINTKLDWQRSYPYGDTLKTILGSVSTSENGIPAELKEYYLEKGYALTDRVGTSYLEYQYEEYLKGTKATYEIMADGSYKELKKGTRGNDIMLTIDIELQKEIEKIVTEELINAKSEPNTEYFDKSFVIVTDPNNGEVLAMVGKRVVNENGSYKVVDYTPGVITTSVTPGSVVKGASQIVGFNTGALQIGEIRNDACIKIAATPIKCSYHEYGNIDDIQALKYSSNTYQFQTAIKVGKGTYVYDGPLKIDTSAFDTYRNTFKQFGLGVKTGIDLPNEALGYAGENTLSGYLLDFSIGQYDTYTPIEISQYIATIANGGKRMRPYLLKAVDSSKDEKLKKQIHETKVEVLNTIDTKDEYMSRVKEGFRQVLDFGGTGSGYVDKAYNAAGKTGTAESFIDSDGDGKIDTETITASFAGYAPSDNPKVTFTIIAPDVGGPNTDYDGMSKINIRITQKVTKKYFEFYK